MLRIRAFPVRIESPAFNSGEAVTEIWIDYGLVRPLRNAWRNIYALMGNLARRIGQPRRVARH